MKYKHPEFEAFLRETVEQCQCGCEGPAQVFAHGQKGNLFGGGTSKKASDLSGVMMADQCHRKEHALGMRAVWTSLDWRNDVVIRNLMAYIEHLETDR